MGFIEVDVIIAKFTGHKSQSHSKGLDAFLYVCVCLSACVYSAYHLFEDFVQKLSSHLKGNACTLFLHFL